MCIRDMSSLSAYRKLGNTRFKLFASLENILNWKQRITVSPTWARGCGSPWFTAWACWKPANTVTFSGSCGRISPLAGYGRWSLRVDSFLVSRWFGWLDPKAWHCRSGCCWWGSGRWGLWCRNLLVAGHCIWLHPHAIGTSVHSWTGLGGRCL
jgi:hypothetical protein